MLINTKLFADGANVETMIQMSKLDHIKGLTTNPTLMRKAGIQDYKKFATEVLKEITDKPISFEIFSDNLEEMKNQALEISSWAENVNVKIPITNTRGESTKEVIKFLSKKEIKLNVTAAFTVSQIKEIVEELNPDVNLYFSVFAGRIADTGQDPIPIMKACLKLLKDYPNVELIWASPRELLNLIQANEIGCHILTATSDILSKLGLIGKDLEEYSLETVRMFRNDAMESGYQI